MLHDPVFHERLRQARLACAARMQATADWLAEIDLSERAAIGQCGHRLAGTLGSFAFPAAAALARELEGACGGPNEELLVVRDALNKALRDLLPE